MYRITFVVLAIVATSGYGDVIKSRRVLQLDRRIVGGNETTIERIPHQVSLAFENRHICGGSIYSKRTIVTAAHCVYGTTANKISVRYGSTEINKNGDIINAERLIPHPQFNSTSFENDVALIILKSDIKFSPKARIIPLATQSPAPRTQVVVSGWGATSEGGSSSSNLKQVSLKIINKTKCRRDYQDFSDITKDMLCAGSDKNGGEDSCQGDSGGPLVANNQLVGIVSWGYGCARPNYPGVYTDVAYFNKWIKDNAGSN